MSKVKTSRHALPESLTQWQPRPGERETFFKAAAGAWESRAKEAGSK